MKLIVGLGNPGLSYKNTRHNLGFMVVDGLLKDFKARLTKDKLTRCLKAKVMFNNEPVVICKPLTYMNLSGEAVSNLARINKVSLEGLLVICDDVNLAKGDIRLKPRGSAGGHNGLASIIERLGSDDFPRLRIGISAQGKAVRLEKYVLSRFTLGEKKLIAQAIIEAKGAVSCWLEYGIQEAMNRYNRYTQILRNNNGL